MNAEDDQLARQLAALAARVTQLEAEVAQIRLSATPTVSARVSGGEGRQDAAPSRASGSRTAPAVPPRNARPSLESRIGSQLFNRIGIIALLVGVAWFLKFAIDNHWIGPAARVLIGLGAGIGIIAGSEWFRKRGYKGFSYSLKALGTGILYLSIWAAYTLFGLIPAWTAFAAMVAVTAANAWLCWRQNSELLAFYAAIGGFLTPLLLRTSESRELTLFSYLLLLDLAVLALVALRPWSRLLLAAFAGTAAYAIGWYVQHYTPASFGLTGFFFVVFFLLFSAAPQLLRNPRLAGGAATLTVVDGLVLLLLPPANALLAFAELYALLSEPVDTHLRAWVAFAFAAFYLAMQRLAQRLPGAPARLPDTYLLLSVLAFTGAVPLALDGRLIAIGWSAESALLFTLAWLRGPRLPRILGGSVLTLAFIATVSLNSALHSGAPILWNARFATYFAGVAAGLFAAWIASQAIAAVAAKDKPAERGWRFDGILAGIGATVLLMIGVCLEIATYWSGQYQIARAERVLDEQFSYSAWTMIFGASMLAAGFWRKIATVRWLGLTLLALSIAKVFLFDLRELSQGYRILSFLGLGALLLAVSFVYQRDLLGLRKAP